MSLAADLARDAGELRQTHISWVFMHEQRVIKVKKPVSLGFVDFSTIELRKRACEAELSLNRRLAPRIYLGLRRITRGPDGVHRVEGEGETVDWAVEMARLPDDDACEARLLTGRLDAGDMGRVARRIADFHAAMAQDAGPPAFDVVRAVADNVEENFEQTRQSAPRYVEAEHLEAIQRFQRGFLEQHGQLLRRRVQAGRVCDGHGDLRLEHVYLGAQGGIDIIDCVEFNERLRIADVCADLAFLSMDLRYHGRDDLAESLLAAYARQSNDFELYRLVDFFESYRAYVRAKVTSMTAEGEGRDEGFRRIAAERARRFYLLAEACGRPPLRPPVVVAVGGVIASGKSTIASGVAEQLGLCVVDADRTRKFMAGVDATHKLGGDAFEGAYSSDATARTYDEVLRRASAVLASGRSVVVDASFRSRAHRARLAHLATERGVPMLLVECRVDEETCRHRLERRARRAHISDGRLAIFDDFVKRFEPFEELPASQHLVLDTAGSLADNLAAVRGRVDDLQS